MDYSIEKIKIIQNYPDEEILSFLNDINKPTERKILNELLMPFVHETLVNEHNNAIKFGEKTKNRYIEALKGQSKGYFSDSKKKKKILPEEKAIMLLDKIFLLWRNSNCEFEYQFAQEYMDKNNIVKSDFDFSDVNFLYFLIDKNMDFQISKETIGILYKFGPFEIDKKLELAIKNCKTRIEILEHTKKQLSSKTLNDLNEEIIGLKNEILEQKQEINFWSDENKILENENKTLKIKLEKSINADIEKIKSAFAKTIHNKDSEINILKNQLEEYEELVLKNEELISQNKTLERFRDFRIEDLNKVLEDKEYGKCLLHLILANKSASKLIIKKLNLKENVIAEGYKYYEQEFLEQNLELERLRQQQQELEQNIQTYEKTNFSNRPATINVKEKSMLFNYNPNFRLRSEINLENFISDYQLELNDTKENATSIHKYIMDNNVIILDSKKEFEAWQKAQNIKIPKLEVIIEHSWKGYEDWFGKFDEEEFFPSKTLIADFYNFIKENAEIPIGFIIFNDFDEILPEIYLLPFIKNLEINKYIDLIHPNCKVAPEYECFKRINWIDNLKFVFVKSNNKNAFDIPYEMEKYKLKVGHE